QPRASRVARARVREPPRVWPAAGRFAEGRRGVLERAAPWERFQVHVLDARAGTRADRRSTQMISSFDETVLPHLHAGRALARWLMRNDDDAEDVVQEASLRALRYFATFDGGDGRAWFLRIVRNTCWSWHGRTQPSFDAFDEELHSSVRPAV